jgi:hypothetical protein
VSYCAYTDIQNVTGSALSQTILEAIIAQADREINARLYEAGLTPPSSDTLLMAASVDLSVAGVMTRHRMDGTQPSSKSVGEASESDTLDGAIAKLRESADRAVSAYIAKAQAAVRLSSRIHKVNG